MAWENSFEKNVSDVRTKELEILKSTAFLNTIAAFSWTVSPFLVFDLNFIF